MSVLSDQKTCTIVIYTSLLKYESIYIVIEDVDHTAQPFCLEQLELSVLSITYKCAVTNR